MSAAASRRKPRVCTREACETCREKKSKCDGEQPCSRCEARGIECHYQVRNHRSKRSLRNELNALKEKQRLQETLLSALQDPQRRDAALRLLETDDPMAGVDALFPQKDHDPDAQQQLLQQQADFDDAGRSTTGSPSPSPRTTNIQQFAASPLRSNSVVSSIAARSDSFPMPGMGDAYADHHMNPFSMNANSPIYGQFTTPFPGAPKNGMPFSGPGAPGNVFAPSWLDPSLNADNAQAQQQIPPYNQPMTDWDGGMDESFRNSIGGGGGNPGIMMAQGGPHQLPQTSSNLSHIGQWDIPAGTIIPSNGTTSRRLSGSHDSASSVPSANSVPSLASSGTSSLVTRASFAPPPPPAAATTRKQRASVSSATSTHSQPRSQSRERHRLASARNWHKQKQATVDLQATKMRVEAQHAALRDEYNEVLGQVQQIKHALLGHAACNDPAIKMWLKREADGVMTGYQQPGEDHAPAAPFSGGQASGEASSTDDAMMRGVEVNVRA